MAFLAISFDDGILKLRLDFKLGRRKLPRRTTSTEQRAVGVGARPLPPPFPLPPLLTALPKRRPNTSGLMDAPALYQEHEPAAETRAEGPVMDSGELTSIGFSPEPTRCDGPTAPSMREPLNKALLLPTVIVSNPGETLPLDPDEEQTDHDLAEQRAFARRAIRAAMLR